ncbi:hypothetical protein D915_010489 [Fasciola hepatica]|uniref:Uncharacterized protein n=1 Tax=Fasciola hepatica TaxID=6192 RepID=A0A4E0QWM8_FASHE|nr:hypothetical protein D915_010489 [Fasciola hepatica]
MPSLRMVLKSIFIHNKLDILQSRSASTLLFSFVRSSSFVCDNCGVVKDLLKPLTDASRSISQEATETASQIALIGEREAKIGLEESNSSTSTPSKETNPTQVPTTSANTTTSKPVTETSVEVPLGTNPEPSTSACSPVQSARSAQWIPNSTSGSVPPGQIAYWLCYPVYFPFFTVSNSGPAIPGTGAGDLINPIPPATPVSTLSTTPSGEHLPLSFSDWLKKAREVSVS